MSSAIVDVKIKKDILFCYSISEYVNAFLLCGKMHLGSWKMLVISEQGTSCERIFTHAGAAEELEDKGLVYGSWYMHREAEKSRAVMKQTPKVVLLCVQREEVQEETKRGVIYFVMLLPFTLLIYFPEHAIKDIMGFSFHGLSSTIGRILVV